MGDVRPFSDRAGKYVVRFDDDTPAKRDELADRLREAGCRVNRNGEDWYGAGIFKLESPPELDFGLSKHCEKLAVCGRTIDDRINNLRTGFIHPVLREVNQLQNKPDEKRSIDGILGACDDAWYTYCTHYERVWPREIEPSLSELQDVATKLQQLSCNTALNDKCIDWIKTTIHFFEPISKAGVEYGTLHETTKHDIMSANNFLLGQKA